MSATQKKILHVLLPGPFDVPFTYFGDDTIDPGQFVQVPFGKRTVTGVVWGAEDMPGVMPSSAGGYAIKDVLKSFSFSGLSALNRDFITWVAEYYMVPKGMVLKMCMSEPTVFKEGGRALKPVPNIASKPHKLSETQQAAADFIKSYTGQFQAILLEGVTGSGKTEVYLDALQHVQEKGQQILVLLPEIALSTQWLSRFEQQFGERPLLWHSDLTPAQRREGWKKVINKDVSVVVGARSALFLPFQDLGLIVVDEEHDQGYKQDSGVLYHARDMAVMRASLYKIPVVLASATPSLETLANVDAGRYAHTQISTRFGKGTMPTIQLVDRRHPEGKAAKGGRWISEALHAAIIEELKKRNQILLFLNRRGYAPSLLCGACGYKVNCKGCDTWLVLHKHDHNLKCHQCGFVTRVPKVCASCGAPDLIPCGPGVERIVEEVNTLFPEARVALMTSDTMNTLKKSKALIDSVQDQKVDIIVGTQIMAKGHDFPHLTLVGVIDGDSGLTGSDLRLMERTYQLLHQVSGRPGRHEKKGRVMIQSHMTDHPLMQSLAKEQGDAFLVFEKDSRKTFGFPPYGRLAALILSGTNQKTVSVYADILQKAAPTAQGIDVFGPVPAPFHKLNHYYRWRFLVKGTKDMRLQNFIRVWLENIQLPRHLRLQIDIDPFNFY